MGFIVYTISTSEAGYSTDEIKNYIQYTYDNFNPPPEYVTLVGDVGNQLANIGLLGVDVSALVRPGQKGTPPVAGFEDGVPSRAKHEKAGQVLVLRAQPVGQPGTEAGAWKSST